MVPDDYLGSLAVYLQTGGGARFYARLLFGWLLFHRLKRFCERDEDDTV